MHQFEPLSGQVIGAAITVHRSLGPGFLESVYHQAMRVALAHRSVPFQSQVCIDTTFEGVVVGRAKIDLIVGNSIVVELKATETLREIHFAQLKSYLRVASLRIGLLLNFNASTLTVRRLLLD